jgi:hypothetical protein
MSELVSWVAGVADNRITKHHNLSDPKVCLAAAATIPDWARCWGWVLGWEPSFPLEQGLASTFAWIATRVRSEGPVPAMVSAAADRRE